MGTCAATKQRKINQNVQITPYKVCITAFIWNKENHNLFDFENNQSTKKEIELDFSATISIVDSQIVALTENEYVKKQTQVMRIECEEDHINIHSISHKTDQRLWAILRSSSEFDSLQEWQIQKNDMIKLGRMKLQLLDYNNQYVEEEIEQRLEQTSKADIQSVEEDKNSNVCRICFASRRSNDDPLFSPCKCIGSMKYIHLKCLQQWISQQIRVKQGFKFTQYIWKRMECEVCKTPLKSTYTYQGNIYCIMNIPKPNVPHMIWKITSEDKTKEGMIHVLELEEKTEIKIGRIPECEIRLKDISVSRSHAHIKVIRDQDQLKFILSDNKSKFGTLLYAQNQHLLKHEIGNSQKVLYQIGKVLIYIQLREKGKNFNKQFTCYKHPSSVQIANKVPINEQATLNPNMDINEQGSFLTHNELNQDEILINIQQPQQKE